jgi:hypothetical protein
VVFIFRGFSPYPLPSDSCIKSSQSNSRAGFGRSLVHHAVGHYCSWWLLEKDISYEERLSRDLLERIYGLREELFSIRS